MVLPALKHLIDQDIEGFFHIMGVIIAYRRGYDLLFRNEFGKFLRDLDRSHLFSQGLKFGKPLFP